jgi:hypothetical protein
VDGANDMLLVLCTSAQSVQEEIWARELGVWNYCPFGDDLAPSEMTTNCTGSVTSDPMDGLGRSNSSQLNSKGHLPRIAERVSGPTASGANGQASVPLKGSIDHAGLLMVFSEARIALANMEASRNNTGAQAGANKAWDLKFLADTSPERFNHGWPYQENGCQDGGDEKS